MNMLKHVESADAGNVKPKESRPSGNDKIKDQDDNFGSMITGMMSALPDMPQNNLQTEGYQDGQTGSTNMPSGQNSDIVSATPPPLEQSLIVGHKYGWTRENSSLMEKDFRNSPLVKGDKGGCKAQIEEESKSQPPPPPFIRGNLSTTSRRFQCPSELMGKGQLEQSVAETGKGPVAGDALLVSAETTKTGTSKIRDSSFFAEDIAGRRNKEFLISIPDEIILTADDKPEAHDMPGKHISKGSQPARAGTTEGTAKNTAPQSGQDARPAPSDQFVKTANPVRNSGGALNSVRDLSLNGINPAGINLQGNPAAEQQGIISNGVPVLSEASCASESLQDAGLIRKEQDKDQAVSYSAKSPEGITLHSDYRRTADGSSAARRVTEPSEVNRTGENNFVITKKDNSSIEVLTEPDGIGKLKIELSLDRGVINAHINVPDAAGKELIERNLYNILNMLTREGLNIGGFSISLGDKKNGKNSGSMNRGLSEDSAADEVAIPGLHGRYGNKMINIFI